MIIAFNPLLAAVLQEVACQRFRLTEIHTGFLNISQLAAWDPLTVDR